MKPANNAPIYTCIYHELAELCREHGYALAVHGSLARDMDVIAIPWVEKPQDPEAVIDAITKTFALRRANQPVLIKHHGRICYGLIFMGEIFVDFNFMPAQAYAEGPLPDQQ